MTPGEDMTDIFWISVFNKQHFDTESMDAFTQVLLLAVWAIALLQPSTK